MRLNQLVNIFNKEFINILLGGGYNSIGEKYSLENIQMLISRYYYFFKRIFPVLIVGILYIPGLLCKKEKKEVIILISLNLGIIGFLLQFFFGSFNHYYLLVIPFASVLTIYILANVEKYKWIFSFFFAVTVLLSIYSTYYNRVYKIYLNNMSIKNGQYILAHEINNLVKSSNNFYIADVGLISQYYLTNKIPPNLKSIGYSFGAALTKEKHLKQIKDADYILKFAFEYNDFLLNSNEVKDALKCRECIELNKDVFLYH